MSILSIYSSNDNRNDTQHSQVDDYEDEQQQDNTALLTDQITQSNNNQNYNNNDNNNNNYNNNNDAYNTSSSLTSIFTSNSNLSISPTSWRKKNSKNIHNVTTNITNTNQNHKHTSMQNVLPLPTALRKSFPYIP